MDDRPSSPANPDPPGQTPCSAPAAAATPAAAADAIDGTDATETTDATGRIETSVSTAEVNEVKLKGAAGDDPAGAASPFAGLLAEANAIPGPVPAPRKAAQPAILVDARARSAEPQPAAQPVTVAKPTPTLDRRIGPYRVLEELGSGGMAVVYKAIQPSLDRIVAIKELRPEYVHDRQIAARFAREAASLATLQHGNIVHIFDYLYDYESAHIVMEFVEGIDLFDLLTATERIPPEVAAIIAVEVAEGLEYAHYRGIVHRDIKPSNILISKNGEVKVMDFGIARDPGNSELTQIGIAVGTPAYMAPEQIRGDRIDFHTDIFALGIVLYEMLTGHKPWPEEEGRSVTVKVLDEPYRPIRDHLKSVPAELERVIARCLEKDPKARYASTYDLRRALELYVHRVVPIDPRGRMVLFLKNRGLISDADASKLVQPALLGDAAIRRRDQNIPLPPAEALLKPVAIGQLAALAVIAGIGLLTAFASFDALGKRLPKSPPRLVAIADSVSASELAARDPYAPGAPLGSAAGRRLPATASAEPKAPESGARPTGARAPAKALTGNEGFVRVIVEPWARVFVDGNFYDLTPFADPIALSPGQHRIAFRNPYFKPIDQIVEIASGQTRTMRMSLLPKEEGDEAGEPH